ATVTRWPTRSARAIDRFSDSSTRLKRNRPETPSVPSRESSRRTSLPRGVVRVNSRWSCVRAIIVIRESGSVRCGHPAAPGGRALKTSSGPPAAPRAAAGVSYPQHVLHAPVGLGLLQPGQGRLVVDAHVVERAQPPAEAGLVAEGPVHVGQVLQRGGAVRARAVAGDHV